MYFISSSPLDRKSAPAHFFALGDLKKGRSGIFKGVMIVPLTATYPDHEA